MSWGEYCEKLDLDAGLGLELLDRREQRVVLGLVEALATRTVSLSWAARAARDHGGAATPR
jgi:hypothetical protein